MSNSFFANVAAALNKTSEGIKFLMQKVLVEKSSLSETDLQNLEKALLESDFGVEIASMLIKKLKYASRSQYVTTLENSVSSILQPFQKSLEIVKGKTNVILVCGTNGNGKTSTIGKLAAYFGLNHKVLVAACDTFRAAAVEQLQFWSELACADFFAKTNAKDPANVAYLALDKAQKEQYDLLLIDTSGRMGNNTNLMEELQKINKILLNNLHHPHLYNTALVLDASVGQTASTQIELFKKSLKITGTIITKLDGSAKAGAIVGIVNKYKTPIYFVTTGEQITNLEQFDAQSFSKALFASAAQL